MLAVIGVELWLKEKLTYLTSINGLVLLVQWLFYIAETTGLAGFKNVKQLVSYAGLDVVINQLGNYKGKSQISKKGGKYIRHVLFNADISFCKFSNTGLQYYQKLLDKKVQKIALERELLTIMFDLWSKDELFDDNYSCNALQHRQCGSQAHFSLINLVALARQNSNPYKTAQGMIKF